MENIAKIEPAIFLVFEGIYDSKPLSEEILNFLFLYSKEFDPSCTQNIRISISNCLKDIAGFGIIQ